MPKLTAFRANSVIFFQGDISDRVFVLQTGKVSLSYTDIENGQELHDQIQTGEFFGVKSALGKYPREENALALQDSTVLAFTVPEFEQVALANARIITKMLKVFSNQLRRIHNQVESLLTKQEQASPEVGLFKTGEYYLKNRMYEQARYVFGRYLTYYPAGTFANQATKNVEIAENYLNKYGQGKGPAPIEEKGADIPRPTKGATQAEMPDVAKAYYNGVSLFSQQKYAESAAEFKKIIDADEDAEYVAKSQYEYGRCLFLTGKFDECLKHFTTLVQTYPKHPELLDVLFYLGQCYEKKADTQRAAALYKKIAGMSSDEESSARLKAKKALRELEGGK
jgi:CRP-like cAMP-binding protein